MLGVHVHFTGPVVSFASICVQLPRAREKTACAFSLYWTQIGLTQIYLFLATVSVRHFFGDSQDTCRRGFVWCFGV